MSLGGDGGLNLPYEDVPGVGLEANFKELAAVRDTLKASLDRQGKVWLVDTTCSHLSYEVLTYVGQTAADHCRCLDCGFVGTREPWFVTPHR